MLGCGQSKESKEILFVCTHGAARSPIAAAYFNKITKEQDLSYHATFRGTEPDENLTTETIKGLTTDGFEINNWKPKKVTVNDINKADKVVTFDCTLPKNNFALSNLENWSGVPSISKDFGKARDDIKKRVERFIVTLKQ